MLESWETEFEVYAFSKSFSSDVHVARVLGAFHACDKKILKLCQGHCLMQSFKDECAMQIPHEARRKHLKFYESDKSATVNIKKNPLSIDT